MITESSKFPFGKYFGVFLGEVPASYLLWLLEQDWFVVKFEGWAEYLELRRGVLESEVRDGF